MDKTITDYARRCGELEALLFLVMSYVNEGVSLPDSLQNSINERVDRLKDHD